MTPSMVIDCWLAPIASSTSIVSPRYLSMNIRRYSGMLALSPVGGAVCPWPGLLDELGVPPCDELGVPPCCDPGNGLVGCAGVGSVGEAISYRSVLGGEAGAEGGLDGLIGEGVLGLGPGAPGEVGLPGRTPGRGGAPRGGIGASPAGSTTWRPAAVPVRTTRGGVPTCSSRFPSAIFTSSLSN